MLDTPAKQTIIKHFGIHVKMVTIGEVKDVSSVTNQQSSSRLTCTVKWIIAPSVILATTGNLFSSIRTC